MSESVQPPVMLVCCPRCKRNYYTSTIHICADKRGDVPVETLARIDAVRKRY